MRKHRGDFLIIMLMLILMGLGLLVMYTIGPVRANFLNAALGKTQYSNNFFFLRQLISIGSALAMFFVFAKVLNYKKIEKASEVALAIALSACLLLAISQVVKLPLAKCELGACRWIAVGGLSIQPAEFVKFAMILYLATLFGKYNEKGKNILHSKEFLVRFLGSLGLSLFFIVVAQKDMGSGIPIAVIALFMLLQSGVPLRSFMLVMVAAVILGVGAIMTSPHRRERVTTYFGGKTSETGEKKEKADAKSYHIENALIAIGSGGLLGVGIGNSVQATGYLPESINDSVFAIMGETFGFLNLCLILMGFAWLLLRVLRVADYSVDYQNSLIAVGVFAWIMTHVVVNVAAMTNIIPLTGITLPLLSYGGTSMMAVGAALGLIYQLSQYTVRQRVADNERMPVVSGPARNNGAQMIEYRQFNNRRRR